MSLRWQQPLCLALFLAVNLRGQADLATVTGVITDSSKALIPGVRVSIRNTGTNMSHTVTSNQEGYYTVPELPAGPYELTAVAAGFEGSRQTHIVLETGETLTIPIKMTIGSVNET